MKKIIVTFLFFCVYFADAQQNPNQLQKKLRPGVFTSVSQHYGFNRHMKTVSTDSSVAQKKRQYVQESPRFKRLPIFKDSAEFKNVPIFMLIPIK